MEQSRLIWLNDFDKNSFLLISCNIGLLTSENILFLTKFESWFLYFTRLCHHYFIIVRRYVDNAINMIVLHNHKTTLAIKLTFLTEFFKTDWDIQYTFCICLNDLWLDQIAPPVWLTYGDVTRCSHNGVEQDRPKRRVQTILRGKVRQGGVRHTLK